MAGLVQAFKIVLLDELSVISSNKAIVSFCQKNGVKITDFALEKPSKLKEIISQKRFMWNEARKLRNEDILFCFYGFDILGLYLIHQLRKKNRVFFCNKDFDHLVMSWPEVLKNKHYLLDLLIGRFMLGLPFSQFKICENRCFLGVKPSSLRRSFLELKISYDRHIFEQNKVIIKNKFNLPNDAIIFIDQGSNAFVVEDRLVAWVEDKFGLDKLFFKPHPNYPISNAKLLRFQQIDKEVPLELICSDEMVLVGVISTVLFDKNIENKKISLINFVKWRSNELKGEFIRMLQDPMLNIVVIQKKEDINND